MRPTKFDNLVYKAIEHRVKTGDNSKFTKELVKRMQRVWEKWAKEEGDYRTGVETYGYEDAESIQINLFYISDRWKVAFRIKWLLDGLEMGKI